MNEINDKEISQVYGGCSHPKFSGNIIAPIIIIGGNVTTELLDTVNNLINNIFSIFKK